MHAATMTSAQFADAAASGHISPAASWAVLIIMAAISLAVFIAIMTMVWRVYQKAGQPGWASIVPVYGTYVMLKIVGKPWWWLLLLAIPFFNLIFVLFVWVDLAKRFGKDSLFALLLIFLPLVGLWLLAYGDTEYQPPEAPTAADDKKKQG